MTRIVTQTPTRPTTGIRFQGLLEGLETGPVLSWGVLDVVPLRLAATADNRERDKLATPEDSLQLVEVSTYGTVVFRNTSLTDRLIVPMHVGFFQPGAQNHATSRALVLAAGETLTATDCFCVQAAQGGLLQAHQQRFMMLPLGLRCQALAKRSQDGYSRLWGEIDTYTRQHGMTTGGHLERFLRPNFARLLPLRHAIETVDRQVGAAYFVAGRLAGVELTPNNWYWHDLAPILTMYCYGPAALLAERRGHQRPVEPVALDGLVGLDDLADRLVEARSRDAVHRARAVNELATCFFDQRLEEQREGLRVVTLQHQAWSGQIVRDDNRVLYASVFRDINADMPGANLKPPRKS